jgi:mRNA-degrading endonuclease RelE of RelBE toxin-antitoxin system
MQSKVTQAFWKCYVALPKHIQELVVYNYQNYFKQNPYHSSLQFKQLRGFDNVYSVRIGIGYRALGKYNAEDDCITWFWIGSHEDYNKLT